METRKRNEEVDETVNSIEGIRRAEASELFTEKVMMRMSQPGARVIRMDSRTVLQAAACLAALIVINLFVWLKTNSSAPEKNEQKNPLAQEYFSYLNSNM